MRALTAVLLSIALTTSLAGSAAFAETPLAPGKPAGIHKAQLENGTIIILAGAAVVAAGIAIAVSNDSNNTTPATTVATTTTS